MEHKCSYCQSILIKGKIYGDRYQMKFMPLEDKLNLGIWVKSNHIPLGKSSFVGRPSVDATYCDACKKIIIDLNS